MYCSKKIILDFDGTIFRVFPNYNLNNLVLNFCNLLENYQTDFNTKSDAFDIFSCILKTKIPYSEKQFLLKKSDEWLTEAELAALDTGILVDGFVDFINSANDHSLEVAIVSNNSSICIEKFLKRYNIRYSIPILGRIGTQPEKMKPNTFMLEEMCKTLKCKKTDVIFIGDNYRDYECATNFGCQFIGMVPTASKKERLCQKTKNIILLNNFFELSNLLWK